MLMTLMSYLIQCLQILAISPKSSPQTPGGGNGIIVIIYINVIMIVVITVIIIVIITIIIIICHHFCQRRTFSVLLPLWFDEK